MSKYFLYVRKSTDVEDKQVRSIDDQLAVLRKLAKEENLNIAAEFVEKQSAKKPGRPVFTELLTQIEKGEAQGIICWKLDRLARNPIDGGQISWMLQKGIIQHIRTFERGYYPQDNVLIMSVEFGMANQYILDLRTNTKRGLMEKVKRGEYASLAPVGYINDVRTKLVIVDKKKSKAIREAYELYVENNSTLEDIAIFLHTRAVSTRIGNPFKRDKISWILSNPFYFGLFKYAGEFYEGKHEPIISKSLFDKVQVVLKQRAKPQKSHNQPLGYCGLLRCGNCGMMITAAKQIKRQKNGNIHEYIYYHCSKKGKAFKCAEPTIRFEELESKLSKIIQDFSLPEDWAKRLYELHEKDKQEALQSTQAIIEETKNEICTIFQKLERLLVVYLEQDIDRDTYLSEKGKLLRGKKSLQGKIEDLERGIHSWVQPHEQWLETAQTAEKIAFSPSLSAKKALLQKMFGYNLFLKNREVSFVPQNQWVALLEAKQKAPFQELSCILVEMARVKLASRTFSHLHYSQS